MSDTHWPKVIQAVSSYALDNGLSFGDVGTLLDLMQAKRAQLLDEDLLDRYIAKQAAKQEAAMLLQQQEANATKQEAIGVVNL